MKGSLEFTLIFFLCAFTCTANAQSWDIDKTIVVDGLTRQYLIHLPPDYNNQKSLPVIFALHGGGGTYTGTPAQYKLNEPADSNGFIVVYPNAVQKTWNMPGVGARKKVTNQDVDDVKFMSVLIDTMVAHYKGDEKRIYFTGISRGGIFSLYLGSKLSNRIRAIAPVCASIPRSIANDYTFAKPMSVLLINGTADPLINYNGGYGRFNKKNSNNENEEADMLPTEELMARLAIIDNFNGVPESYEISDSDPKDKCTAIKFTYNCAEAKLIEIKIINGGHTWPGGVQYLPKIIIGNLCRDFSAADEIVQFFMSEK